MKKKIAEGNQMKTISLPLLMIVESGLAASSPAGDHGEDSFMTVSTGRSVERKNDGDHVSGTFQIKTGEEEISCGDEDVTLTVELGRSVFGIVRTFRRWKKHACAHCQPPKLQRERTDSETRAYKK